MTANIACGFCLADLSSSTALMVHRNERVGSTANYIGRWVNRRMEPGPWSQPVGMLLAIPAPAAGNATLAA